MNKLDFILFKKNVDDIIGQNDCSIIKNAFAKICKVNADTYIGISTIRVDNKIVGYVITKKNYIPIFPVSDKYDLILIIITVIAVFIFNFVFLFLALKKKIEYNTTRLIDIISLEGGIDKKIVEIDIEEYEIIAKKFSAEKKHIAMLEAEKSYFQARKDIAAQVAHDINSPVAVIYMMLNNANFASEKEKVLFNNALQKIRDITDRLIKNYRCNNDIQSSKFLILEKITQIISQKHIEWSANPCEIIFDTDALHRQPLYLNIPLLEFDRMVSNLLNNAYEALEDKRYIKINLFHKDDILKLVISDTGSGIEDSKITLILNGTSLKHSGNGLGLSHAKKFMAHCGGFLDISSVKDQGTVITLTFPNKAFTSMPSIPTLTNERK
jgi:signal transduction histidine kinase